MGEQPDELREGQTDAADNGGVDQGAASPEAVAGLQQALEAQKAQSAEYLEGWQRARAEFANYRRRVEKEQSETYQNATARVIARFLDVLDDFDRAMKDRPTEAGNAEAYDRWAEGVGLIQRKLSAILDAEGVAPIEADGQTFDPNLHEAISHEDHPDGQPGQVIATVRRGYRIGDRVIRPALVRVAR